MVPATVSLGHTTTPASMQRIDRAKSAGTMSKISWAMSPGVAATGLTKEASHCPLLIAMGLGTSLKPVVIVANFFKAETS